jgi:hypothetical protein
MSAPRFQRVRVLDALEQVVKGFRTGDELYPLRVPHEPLSLDDLVDAALAGEARRFDPRTLAARTILGLEWADGSRWDLWVIVLPSKVKVYCDSGEDESRVLASGGRNEGDQSDRLLLELLASSRGRLFGIEMDGDVPSRVRSSVGDRGFLVDVFVDLIEGTALEAAVSRRWSSEVSGAGGRDFRADVERWLAAVSAAADGSRRS